MDSEQAMNDLDQNIYRARALRKPSSEGTYKFSKSCIKPKVLFKNNT